MPIFKTTKNILTTPWEDELWDDNWMDSDSLVLPPKIDWDYSRELKIEDVNIWEQIYYQGGGFGIYASWDPYAEFYLVTGHHFTLIPGSIETYYGPEAQKEVIKRAKEMGVELVLSKIWVEPEDMWKYKK
jgi:hypothetical protein